MNSTLNGQFLISLLIILLGYSLKRCNIIKDQDGESLARIVFNITLPSLILVTFSHMVIDLSLLTLSGISILYGCLMAIVGVVIFRKEIRTTRGMLAMVCPSFNIGLFAYPLVEAIWGQEGLKYFGMFDIGNSLVTFVLCYLIANYFSPESSGWDVKAIFVKLSKSIPLLSYLVAITLTLTGLHLPSTVLDIAQVVSKANAPLSLLLLGVYLNFSFEPAYIKNAGKVLFSRYVIGLAVGLFFYFSTPFNALFKDTLLVGLILPIAAAVIPFAIEFNYDQKFVGTVTNITTLISFVLVWLLSGTSLIAA